VLTTARLVVLHDEQIAAAVPRAALNGEVRTAAAGVEVRVRTEDGGVLIAGFRSANKLVDRLKTLLRPPGEAAPDPS
jgi:hypothetical protein